MSPLTFRHLLAPKIVLAVLGIALLCSSVFVGFGLLGSPRLFKKVRHDGQAFFTLNPAFARSLQPGVLGHAMPPVWVAAMKPESVRRVVLLGGSASAGAPMTDYHLGRLIEARWRARFPGEPVEVSNLSAVAADPRLLRGFAREAMALDPDMIVLCADGTNSPECEGDIRDIVRRARARDLEVLLVCLPVPREEESAGENFCSLLRKVASDSGPGVAVVDAGLWLHGHGAPQRSDELLFPGSSDFTFAGRVAVAELIIDGMAASWALGPRDETPEAVAAWWQRLPAAEAEVRRDTLFTGYDEHDMWSLALKSLPADAPQRGKMGEKARELRRQAKLGWDTTDIVVAYERAQLQNPADPLTHFTAGRLFGLRGEGIRGEEAFRRGFDLQPNNASALLDYAAMQISRGDTEAARTSLQTLEKYDPQADGLIRMQAAVAMREAELTEAAALLQKHLAHEPGDAESWLTLSEIQLKLGDFAASEASRLKGKSAVGR